MFGVTRDVPLAQGDESRHLEAASDIALAAPSPTGYMLTLMPWHGRALVGTWQSDSLVGAGRSRSDRRGGRGFHRRRQRRVPGAQADPRRRDARAPRHRAGRRSPRRRRVAKPWRRRSQFRVAADPRSRQRTVRRARCGSSAIKYTTARAVGDRAAAAAAKSLGGSTRRTDTATAILPGAGIADHEALAIETARAVAPRAGTPDHPSPHRASTATAAAAIVRADGRAQRLAHAARARPADGRRRSHPRHPRTKWRCTLADIVIRRSELGAMGHPGADLVKAMAAIAAEELGWDADRRDREIAAVDAFYC